MPEIGGSSISELSGASNIFSPQFCLEYPSSKTLFLVSTPNEIFDRFEIRSELRISGKTQIGGSSSSKLSLGTNIFSPQFCLKYPSSKTLFTDLRSGEYSERSRSIWAQEFRDWTSGCTRFPSHDTQSVVIPVPNMQILDKWSQTNWFEALLIMNTSVAPISMIWAQIHLSLNFWYWQIPFKPPLFPIWDQQGGVIRDDRIPL